MYVYMHTFVCIRFISAVYYISCVYLCTEGAFIEVTDEQPLPSTMSLVLTDILGVRTYCTGLRFYRPFIAEEVSA